MADTLQKHECNRRVSVAWAIPAWNKLRIGSFGVIVSLVIGCLPSLARAAEIPREIKLVESRAIDGRRKIHSGYIRIRCERPYDKDNPWDVYELYFTPGSVRENATFPYDKDEKPSGKEEYTRTTIQGELGTYRYSTKEFLDGKTYVLAVNEGPADPLSIWDTIPDPRVTGFGFGASLAGNHSKLDTHINGPNRENVVMIDELFDGIDCKKISWRDTKNQVDMEVWIAPSMDYSPIRMRSSFERDGSTYVNEEVSKCVLFEKNNSWFPERAISTRSIDGKVVAELSADIDVVCLNCEIPDDVFLPASIDVPVGTNVMFGYDTDRRAVWDGSNVADIDPLTAIQEGSNWLRSGKWWLVVVTCVFFAIVLFYVGVRALRKT
ncbi:hypothetical protein [Blastopirellula marina]|uniref:Uncharacterized protein n=1 Tax=Blastopirellula marina TaxID=124 RepID=A0A2S8F6U4_9BACT|nr:hypothetical protein [Blastopirellula marina]PQO27881.1 hypothetical protein C5Y98_26515 [Blastopirellula marina]PTL41617.1 hypothetical protein C5Y97_26530 [Blastopirellula marina]